MGESGGGGIANASTNNMTIAFRWVRKVIYAGLAPIPTLITIAFKLFVLVFLADRITRARATNLTFLRAVGRLWCHRESRLTRTRRSSLDRSRMPGRKSPKPGKKTIYQYSLQFFHFSLPFHQYRQFSCFDTSFSQQPVTRMTKTANKWNRRISNWRFFRAFWEN